MRSSPCIATSGTGSRHSSAAPTGPRACPARPSRLSGAEVDELVGLYQRVATHLSVVQTRSPDPVLVARLSRLVAAARAAVVGARAPAWRQVARFFTVVFPVAVYRARRWWVPAALVSLAVATGLAVWV